ncbi:MAG TPA: hypothetical protein VG225_01405 [Terracidiphilus sp.]|nr:hypothetical protein [Terracidiphilus sp.]
MTIYGGYSYLSNSFNNHSTYSSGSGMNGWDADVTLPAFRSWNLKLEGLGFYDNNLGDAERAHFFLAGPVLKHRLGKDTLFAQGLAGYGHINAQALSLGGEGANTNTFAADVDGGIDIPFAPRIAWRVQGGVLYSAFGAQSNQISGLPRWFGRLSTGVVLRF